MSRIGTLCFATAVMLILCVPLVFLCGWWGIAPVALVWMFKVAGLLEPKSPSQ